MSKNSPVKTFALQFLRAVIAGLTVVLYSRLLGSAGRGELSLMLFYINLAMIVNEYVGGSSLANLIPRLRASNVHPTAVIWAILVCLLATGGYMLAGFQTSSALLMGAYSIALALLTIHYNVYQGLGKVYQRNRIQLALESLKMLLLIGLMVASALGEFLWDVEGMFLKPDVVMTILGVSTLVIYFVSTWWLRKDLRTPGLTERVPVVSALFHSGFWAQNGQLVQFLNYRLSLLMIDHFLGLSETGIYSNTLLIADTIWIFGNSFGTIAHMRILRSENAKFRADITMRYAAISFFGTAIACFLLWLVPNSVFVWVFGIDFAQLQATSLWFIPSILALGLSTVFSHYLHAVNRFKTLLLANLSGLVVQVLLGLWLIPSYGLPGAALAAGAGFITILLFVWLAFKKDHPQAAIKGVFRVRSLWRVLVGR